MRLSVTLREATVLTGLSRSTFYKLFNTGQLQPRKAGKRTLILFRDLEALISSLPSSEVDETSACGGAAR